MSNKRSGSNSQTEITDFIGAKKQKLESDNGPSSEATVVWHREGTLLWLVYPASQQQPTSSESASSSSPSSLVYGFDLDSTLIETKSGKTFATNRNDWRWLYPEIPTRLRELHEEGKRLAIFSNQGGIAMKGKWDSTKAAMIQGKVEDVIRELKLPIWAFMACGDDHLRKPSTAMWDFMSRRLLGGESPNKEKSMYIGDAAGRALGWKSGSKKDFSCSDRKFAHNIGIPFHTPEEFFKREHPAQFKWDTFDVFSAKFHEKLTDKGESPKFHSDSQEIVLMCGFPGSGKTTFATQHFVSHGYVHINRDTLSTPKKCYDAALTASKAGKSVVVDNTLPKFECDDKDRCNGRKAYVDLARQFSIPIRVFLMGADEALAKHLNHFRARLTNGKSAPVPQIAYNVFKKNYVPPNQSVEGFNDVITVNFVPRFSDERASRLFYQFA